LLLGILLVVAWLIMGYALVGYRLLNRKLFVSRKVVYASITPIAFSVFFIFIGLMSLMSRLFGWTVPFALQWLVIVLGALAILVLALSADVRRRIKYFISTHFYVNKYEYRDEWLAFSDLLQGQLNEKGVVAALYQILHDCLYTRKILIWLGDIKKGFHLTGENNGQGRHDDGFIAGDDAIVCYLHNAPYLYSQEGDEDPLRQSILKEREAFLQAHDIVLMVPLILGSQCVGMVGLGPETTGGRYGHDDFDLLAALSSHAASALLAIQNAEELARAREQSAWSNLSTFVLHDIKNAATMLDLVRKNAGEHMADPEFQKDMLESIDDALKRMGKVQTRLSALRDDMVAQTEKVAIEELMAGCIGRLSKKLPDLEVVLEGCSSTSMETDPDFVYRILENLLINALEAGARRVVIRTQVRGDAIVQLDLQDDGPGISADLLPRVLFDPFKTSKANGSGIGLWQVRQLVERLGGHIQARNSDEGGRCSAFCLQTGLGDGVVGPVKFAALVPDGNFTG
jgi:putative PEP-CTERM system histidine kinase